MNTHALLVAILAVVVFGVGFMLGRMTAPLAPAAVEEGTASMHTSSNGADRDTATTSAAAMPAEGVSVDASALSPGQRQLLESLGIDADSITITKEMVACAEAKLDAARLEEIRNGATPTFTEGVQLVACYQ